jgi:hypothetical protein
MDDAIFRYIGDLNQLCTCKFATPSRRDVLWIARYPKRIKAKFAGKRSQKPQGAICIPMATMSGIDGVADVSSVQLDVRSRRDAQIDGAKFLSGNSVNHTEMVSWSSVQGVRRKVKRFEN